MYKWILTSMAAFLKDQGFFLIFAYLHESQPVSVKLDKRDESFKDT